MALVAFPVLAYGVVTVLSDGELPWQGSDSSVSDEGTATDEETEPVAEETEEAVTPSPEETPTQTATPTPTPVVDLTRAVEVFNSTSTAGLAGSAGDQLEAVGFTAVSTGNWDGDDLAASVVYYPAAADVATAQTAAATLGIGSVVESAEQAPDGIVVVLAADFTP